MNKEIRISRESIRKEALTIDKFNIYPNLSQSNLCMYKKNFTDEEWVCLYENHRIISTIFAELGAQNDYGENILNFRRINNGNLFDKVEITKTEIIIH